MKELSTEEKARMYDEAIKRVEDIKTGKCKTRFMFTQGLFEHIFPAALKESEDERIRKEIVQFIQMEVEDEIVGNKWIAWLEKQGEHAKFRDSIQVGDKVTRNRDGVLVNLSQLERLAKPADKVEPKFKIGDYLVNDYCKGKVIELTDDAYLLDTEQGIPFSYEHNAHLWTIQDAKEGDVLCSNQIIVLFKQWEDNTDYSFVIAHAGIDISGKLQITNGHWLISNKSKPATKEQRDLLFQKMHEAGYEWDAEKKELKKIEQKAADTEKGAKGNDREIPNSAWSGEDESKIKGIINTLEGLYDNAASDTTKDLYRAKIDWLKSLKDRYTWRPSDEQMKALKEAVDEHFVIDGGALWHLYEDLKKLMEE